MKKLLFLFFSFSFLALSLTTHANIHLAPPSFSSPLPERAGQSIFVDFKQAHYEIQVDTRTKRTRVKSTIRFVAGQAGFPVFDLIPRPSKVMLNNQPTTALLTSLPDKQSEVRVLTTSVLPGEHILEIENEISENVVYTMNRQVSMAFWIRDLKSRMFWEQYVPSNLEFDQYAISIDLQLKGRKTFRQEVHANGTVKKLSSRRWLINYPEWYSVSSPYLHTFPRGAKRTARFFQTSIDGRKIPITIYTFVPWELKTFVDEFKKVFVELENDYGPWPHPFFIAYGAGLGGMEHAGATMTSLGALDHEMLHCYFAKGVLPADGNSGWIDEAIASWRDRGYYRAYLPPGKNNLYQRSIYARNTDRRSYKHGSAFMAHLDFLLQDSGGLKAFLKGYAQTYKFTVINTDHFINNLEFFSGYSLRDLFEEHVGKGAPSLHTIHSESEAIDENHQLLPAWALKRFL